MQFRLRDGGLDGRGAGEEVSVQQRLVEDEAAGGRGPLRAVRVEAARTLAGTSEEGLPSELAQRLRTTVNELIATELATAERPESHVNLAQIYARLGRNAEAEQELHTALRLDRRFVAAMVNLADLYRAQGREDEAEQWLRQAVSLAPRAPEPVHALGLLEVRRGQSGGAGRPVNASLRWAARNWWGCRHASRSRRPAGRHDGKAETGFRSRSRRRARCHRRAR